MATHLSASLSAATPALREADFLDELEGCVGLVRRGLELMDAVVRAVRAGKQHFPVVSRLNELVFELESVKGGSMEGRGSIGRQ